MKPTQIILKAESDLHDNELRGWFETMQRKMDALNERSKSHTKDIMKLRKEIKRLGEGK